MLCFLGALGTQEDPGTPLPFLDNLSGAQTLLSNLPPPTKGHMGRAWGGGSLNLPFSWTFPLLVCVGVYRAPL